MSLQPSPFVWLWVALNRTKRDLLAQLHQKNRDDTMTHKRSPQGQKKQNDKKALKYEAKQFINANSYSSTLNIEDTDEAYKLTPQHLINHLTEFSEGGFQFRTVNPQFYGSILTGSEVLAQAAQGLVIEGTIR